MSFYMFRVSIHSYGIKYPEKGRAAGRTPAARPFSGILRPEVQVFFLPGCKSCAAKMAKV